MYGRLGFWITIIINTIAAMSLVEKYVDWILFFQQVIYLYDLILRAPVRWLQNLSGIRIPKNYADIFYMYCMTFWAMDMVKKDSSGSYLIEWKDFKGGNYGGFWTYVFIKLLIFVLAVPFFLITAFTQSESRWVISLTIRYLLRIVIFIFVLAYLNWTLYNYIV